MIQSYLKSESIFFEDTLPSSKYVGITAFDKYNSGIFSDSLGITAMYLKKSSAESKGM